MWDPFGNLTISVGKPWWLVLIPLLIPALILVQLPEPGRPGPVAPRSRRSASARWSSRLIVLALAEVQTVRTNDRLTTIFLLDVSQSVPSDWQRAMLDFVNRQVDIHKRNGDLAGVIVFGKAARVEVPPTPYFSPMLGIESVVDTEYTDLAAAIKLALATFPEDTARRIVLLSDGNENRGNALEQALAASSLKRARSTSCPSSTATTRRCSSRRSRSRPT